MNNAKFILPQVSYHSEVSRIYGIKLKELRTIASRPSKSIKAATMGHLYTEYQRVPW